MPPKLELSCPTKTYLERAYNLKLQKKTFLNDIFLVSQAKFSCDFYFFWRIAPFHVLKSPPPITGTPFLNLRYLFFVVYKCYQSGVIRILFTSKNQFLPVFLFITYFREVRNDLATCHPTYFRVLQFDCNTCRALIHTPSCLFKHAKCTCTGFPSRNPISSTLDTHNFFLAENFSTIFWGKS
jgi:hypothetical protein